MRHRYIFSGLLDSHKISSYRLISKLTYSLGHCVRVNIPDDLELVHYPGDGYSTTEDERTIDELGYDCYFLYKGKWRKFNWLKNIEPCWWFRALDHIFGLYDCYDDKVGYTDDVHEWKEIAHSKERIELSRKCCTGEAVMHYPHLIEDKKGLKLEVKLDKDIEFLRNTGSEDEWIKFYDEFAKQLKENPNRKIFVE